MSDFLLELLCEEIPARMQARARNDLARMFAEALGGAGLTTGAVDVHSTPRRLVLIARDVADETAASREEVKGPRSSAPPQALEGFLRKTGLVREQLEERDGVLFAIVERTGQSASAVIAEALGRILVDFPWPKSMRWGSGDERWVRPLQGIVAMLGDAIVPVEFAGVKAGATTVGHRFHHPGKITVGGAGDYVEKLRLCHVIVDQDERERIIREGAAEAAAAAKLKLVEDEGLVVENAGLTEWPVPLLGRFDADYLDVPREVIVLTMRTNQKYFACTDGKGALAPAFVCVANIDANDEGAAIVEGNKRVLAARLSDARFFWKWDLETSLYDQAKRLNLIIFHEKLGTVADKANRIAQLADWLIDEDYIKAPPEEQVETPADYRISPERWPEGEDGWSFNSRVTAATVLCKADLISGLVGEFPELQGIVGGYIARNQGLPPTVADAIRDHYKPVGPSDEVPSEPVTVTVSLADKLDTLCQFFHIGEVPTGSKDPFALRRTGLAIIRLILENGLRMPLLEVLSCAVDDINDKAGTEQSAEKAFLFLVDRLKVQQREAGVRHDLIDAVFALGGEDDLVRLLARVKALQDFVATEEGRDLLAGYKRAANILKKEEGSWTPDQVRCDDLPGEEAALIAALDAAGPKAAKAVETEDFTTAMSALASLRTPIDLFFDKVTVNDPDKGVRARRLSLLARFRDAVHSVADFSKIEG